MKYPTTVNGYEKSIEEYNLSQFSSGDRYDGSGTESIFWIWRVHDENQVSCQCCFFETILIAFIFAEYRMSSLSVTHLTFQSWPTIWTCLLTSPKKRLFATIVSFAFFEYVLNYLNFKLDAFHTWLNVLKRKLIGKMFHKAVWYKWYIITTLRSFLIRLLLLLLLQDQTVALKRDAEEIDESIAKDQQLQDRTREVLQLVEE